MKYSITSNDIQSFYNKQYIQNTTDDAFSFSRDKIDMDVLTMTVNEWKTPKLKVHMIQTETQKDIHILGGVNPKLVVLHFVCEGETKISPNPFYPESIPKNTNNLFCTKEGSVEHVFNKGRDNRYFKVFLPLDYIESMVNKYPEIFGTLSMMIKNQCPVLLKGNLTTTLEMKMVIEQIKITSDMGTLAPFYFETKIQELLALQMQQIARFKCPECEHYKYYLEQLNEARNFLELHFQNPPTIAQLAQHVGMSETVLKINFKRCFGVTIYGYLFDYRMDIARKLLTDISMTVAEIGYRTGYEHPSHFTCAFKRKYGISPVEFRAQRA